MRTSNCLKNADLITISLAISALMLSLVGCGNKENASEISTSPVSTTPHVSASGPAVSGPVSFSQLTLESTPSITKDKNGLEFLKFRYADNDGKVYNCIMPKAMSDGQYTLGEWLSTFNAYRIQKVVAQKKVIKRKHFGDFPFISPTPTKQDTTTGQSGDIPALPAPPGTGTPTTGSAH